MPDKHQDEEPSEFKVIDRRPFTAEGERRSDVESEAPRPEPKAEPKRESAPPPPPPPKGAASEPRAQAAPGPQGPVSFEHLVMSLATTAMFQLGLVKSPEDEPPRVDLPAAKETIDLLEILQQKTKGNLTKEEESLLNGSLYELHMVFVELTKARQGR